VGWATDGVDLTLLKDPAKLVTERVYARVGNLMCMACAVIDLAIALLADSWWPVLFLIVLPVIMDWQIQR
jgi:hypothetical protein